MGDAYNNEREPLDLDYVLAELDGLREQEKEIAAERADMEKILAEHRPEALRRIVAQVNQYLGIMGGTKKELINELPFLADTPKTTPTKKEATRREPIKRTGGWRHAQTGVTYKGGKLPNALAAEMLADDVDLDDKGAKKAWIEANCEKVAA